MRVQPGLAPSTFFCPVTLTEETKSVPFDQYTKRKTIQTYRQCLVKEGMNPVSGDLKCFPHRIGKH